ncbi:MAG: O-antigen ligase family protein [Pirellulales bacterium]
MSTSPITDGTATRAGFSSDIADDVWWTDPFVPRPGLISGIVPRSPAMWIAGLYLFVVILRPWEVLFPWLQAVKFERFFTLSVIGVIGLTRGFRFRPDWQTLTVIGMVIAMWIAAANAVHPDIAWMGPSSAYEFTATALIFVCLISAAKTPYDLAFLLICYVTANVLYTSKAQWEFWLHGAGAVSMGVTRLRGIDGTNGHPNAFVTLILTGVPFNLLLWWHRDTICASWPGIWRKLFRWGLNYALVLAFVSSLMTNSRAGFLTMFVMASIGIALRGSWIQIAKLSAGLVLVLAVTWPLLPESTRGRFLSIVDKSASNESAAESAEGRVLGFKAGMEIFRRFPMTGVGPANFVPYRVAHLDGVKLDPHNLLAEVLAATGLLGGTMFALFLLAMWGNTVSLIRGAGDSSIPALLFYRHLGLAIRFSLLSLLMLGLFTHNLFRIEWMLLAAVGLLGKQFMRRRQLELEELAIVDGELTLSREILPYTYERIC